MLSLSGMMGKSHVQEISLLANKNTKAGLVYPALALPLHATVTRRERLDLDLPERQCKSFTMGTAPTVPFTSPTPVPQVLSG